LYSCKVKRRKGDNKLAKTSLYIPLSAVREGLSEEGQRKCFLYLLEKIRL